MLLAEHLCAGISVALPRRSKAQLEKFCGKCYPQLVPTSSERAGYVAGLAVLVVTETCLTHYTGSAPKTRTLVDPDLPHDVDEKYWKRRYNYFSKFDEGIRMDAAGWFEVTPESVARHIADRLPFELIVDGTCGVGGNAIQFALTSQRVIAVDTDRGRLNDAAHNAAVYNVQGKIEFVCDDFINFARMYPSSARQPDAVFLSPPWGGPAHLDAPSFSLLDVLEPNLVELFVAATSLSQRVVLYLPRHQDLNEVALLAQGAGFAAVEVEKVFFQHPTPHLKLCVLYFRPESELRINALRTSRSIRSRQHCLARPRRHDRAMHQHPAALFGSACCDLLSSSLLAGPLLRALYWRVHYVGKYFVAVALRHSQLSVQPSQQAFRESLVGALCVTLQLPHAGSDAAHLLRLLCSMPLRSFSSLILETLRRESPLSVGERLRCLSAQQS